MNQTVLFSIVKSYYVIELISEDWKTYGEPSNNFIFAGLDANDILKQSPSNSSHLNILLFYFQKK